MLERLLRRGVLCEVYLARGEGGGTARYEVRRVHGQAPTGAETSVRRELERVASVGCRVIPALAGVEIDPAGLLVVTEAPEALAPRDTLRDLLQRDARVAVPDALRILKEIARALDALHALVPPVVHRGLSPENVLLMDRRRRIWVTECGLAHALTAAGVISPRSAVSESAYGSPDELLHRATTRGDVFTFASLAYEVLSGKPAYGGASAAAVEGALLRGARPSLSEALGAQSERADAVLAQAWSSDPQLAFARASELAAALEVALESKSGGGFSSKTIIGLGSPSAKGPPAASRPSAPRAAPPAGFASPPVAPRALPPTQKVLVPRIHPPGTQPVAPVAPSAEDPAAPKLGAEDRPTKPAASLRARVATPEFNDVTRPVRIEVPPEAVSATKAGESSAPEVNQEPPARDSWEAMLDVDLPPQESTAVLPPVDAPPSPPPSEGVEEAPQVTAPSADEAPTLVPPTPASEDADDLELEALLDVSAEAQTVRPPRVSEAPPLPPPAARRSTTPPPPPPPRASQAPSLPPSAPADAHAEVDFDGLQSMAASAQEIPEAPPLEPQAPPLEPQALPLEPQAPPLDPQAPAEFDRLPSLFDGTDEAPSVPPPVATLPPVPPPTSAMHEAAPSRAVYPELTVAAADSVLEGSKTLAGRGRSAAVVVGVVLVVAGVVGGGLAWKRAQEPATPPVALAPEADAGPATPAPAALEDAALPTAVDVGAAPTSDVVDDTDAALAAQNQADVAEVAPDHDLADAAIDAVPGTADASAAIEAPLVTADAGPPPPSTDGGLFAPVIRGEPLRGHPRYREFRALEDAMYDDVIRCAAGSHRRRVRVSVRYVGATGLVDRVRVAAPYSGGETGACIEAVVRRHPVGRFSSEDWETYFVFDPDDA
ncbi:MAG: protein kinase [Polyangiales bacterium]